ELETRTRSRMAVAGSGGEADVYFAGDQGAVPADELPEQQTALGLEEELNDPRSGEKKDSSKSSEVWDLAESPADREEWAAGERKAEEEPPGRGPMDLEKALRLEGRLDLLDQDSDFVEFNESRDYSGKFGRYAARRGPRYGVWLNT